MRVGSVEACATNLVWSSERQRRFCGRRKNQIFARLRAVRERPAHVVALAVVDPRAEHGSADHRARA